MAIEVGDAVLRMIADTTDLDAAFNRVADEAGSKLQPVKDNVNEVAGAWQFAGHTASTAGEETSLAAAEMSEGAKEVSVNMREAQGTIALLGEEVGIRMPRHVRSFVASLPGVGEALEAAFSAVAVIALIEVIVEATKKISEFIADHFIYTEAMKEVEKQVGVLNKALLEQKDAYDKAHEALRTWGFSAQQLADDAVEQLSKKIKENEAELRNASNTIYFYRNGLGGTAEDAQKAGDQVTLLTATLKAQNEQLTLLQLQQQKVAFEAYVKNQDELITIAKTKATDRAKAELLAEQLKLTAVKLNYEQEAQAKSELEEKLYRIDLNALQQHLNLLKLSGNETKDEQVKTEAQIEELERQHALKLYGVYVDFKQKLAALRLQDIPLVGTPLPDSVTDQTVEDFNKVKEAAQEAGVSLSSDMFKAAQDAGNAYNALRASGVASMGDLLRAQIALSQATINYRKDLGESTKDEEKHLNELNDAYDKLQGKVDKTHKATHDFFQQFQIDMKHGVDGMDSVKTIGTEAFNALAAGIQSAVASAILSQQALGQALEQATAQALAQLAAQAIVKALFYTAEGFAALAGFSDYSASQYFAAAGEMALVGGAAAVAARALNGASNQQSGSGAPTNSQPINTSPVGTVQAPVHATNVQHFASGGLVSKRTLAVIGDSNKDSGDQEEAAIPLNDPAAVKKIVEALGGGGPTIHVHVQGLVSPDNLTKVMKQINRKVTKGQGTLVSSNSLRLTKRSQ